MRCINFKVDVMYLTGLANFPIALGEEEVKVALGKDKTLQFTNIEHLASLDPEDFLSMRLYTNQDAGNILWEYAFDYLALDTRIAGYDHQTDETWYVTADDPTVPFQAVLVGFANRDPASKTPQTIQWSAQSIGTMNTSSRSIRSPLPWIVSIPYRKPVRKTPCP